MAGKYTKPHNYAEIRRAAWKTRREKYGPSGATVPYRRPGKNCSACDSMKALIVKLHVEGILSEGQAAEATGLDRVELRRQADLVYGDAR